MKFQTDSEKGRLATREKYRKEEPELHNNFRITIDGLLGRMSNQLLQTFDNPTEINSYQLSLVASFLRSHFLINDLIINSTACSRFVRGWTSSLRLRCFNASHISGRLIKAKMLPEARWPSPMNNSFAAAFPVSVQSRLKCFVSVIFSGKDKATRALAARSWPPWRRREASRNQVVDEQSASLFIFPTSAQLSLLYWQRSQSCSNGGARILPH